MKTTITVTTEDEDARVYHYITDTCFFGAIVGGEILVRDIIRENERKLLEERAKRTQEAK